MPAQTEAEKRVSTMVPADDARALELNAKENGRSVASELRLAVQAWLKQIGRRA
jgi:hypothetical protein